MVDLYRTRMAVVRAIAWKIMIIKRYRKADI